MMGLMSVVVGVAGAQEPAADAYTTAVQLVENLYLEPEKVSAEAMLGAAARNLSADVPWLFVEPRGDGWALIDAAGAPLGEVQANALSQLPSQLQAMEEWVVARGGVPAAIRPRVSLLDGMTRALDPFSRVLWGEGLVRFDTRLRGTLVGVGASFRIDDDVPVIASVHDGGPAFLAGLRAGDRVESVDGRGTTNLRLADLAERVRGPVGSTVVFAVRRDDDRFERAVRRAEVVVPNVTHRALGGGVGYVHIEHVSQQTVGNLRAALASLGDDARAGLVIDLRGNTGGSMKEAARAADVLLTAGVLLRTVGADGGAVQNLEAEMIAVDDGHEPQVPVVVLVDERTASGAEIMVGAWLAYDRVAVVGTRTYGKGTVQKIYDLDDDVRLKLTVARFLVADDQPILPSGIEPDVWVGSLVLEDDRVIRQGLDVPAGRLSIAAVDDRTVARAGAEDVALVVAERALRRAVGASRAAALSAVQAEARAVAAEQEARWVAAMEARGLDWSAAVDEGSFPALEVTAVAHPEPGDVVRVEVTATSTSEEPLHRVYIALDAPYTPWHGATVALGLIPPGERVAGQLRVPLGPGVGPRVDDVALKVLADQRPPLHASTVRLRAASAAAPAWSADVRVVPHGGLLGPRGQPVWRAEITAHNRGPGTLTGLELAFGAPDDPAIELIDAGARRPRLGPGERERVDLTFERAAVPGARVALELQVDAERHGALGRWPLSLPLDGAVVAAQAPTIRADRLPEVASAGPFTVPLKVRDDRALAHAWLKVNGVKVSYVPGAGPELKLAVPVTLRAGSNRLEVVAEDDQGLVSRATYWVYGEVLATADGSDR